MQTLEKYFEKFRNNIVGSKIEYPFHSGTKKIIYADWAASGRLYKPIEEYLLNTLGPYVANTHTEATLTSQTMTTAYHQAREVVKTHVNASNDDILIFTGFGMTAAVNKLQRLLNLRIPDVYKDSLKHKISQKPLVIITHMEHHSNQTSWLECCCDVEIINRGDKGCPDLNHLREILKLNKNRERIYGAFTACSNVTGVKTPYHEMAEIIHEFGGYCFIDFAASAPYVKINMHPSNELQKLDAIYFSPHKFLGGPGSSGVLVLNRELYNTNIPDQPGGGTVAWTNPWGEHRYFDNIEIREDGGTPGFLQAIRASLAILLKEEMGIQNICDREEELKNILFNRLSQIPNLNILEADQKKRLGFVSFYLNNIHHNLVVKFLNDKFGIQARGGCSCAGTYGHVLLQIDYDESHRITDLIDQGDFSDKPGWVRVSLNPTMTNNEAYYIINAIEEIAMNKNNWKEDYQINKLTGEYESKFSETCPIDLKEVFQN